MFGTIMTIETKRTLGHSASRHDRSDMTFISPQCLSPSAKLSIKLFESYFGRFLRCLFLRLSEKRRV